MMKAENKIGWVFQKRLIFILFVLLLPVVWSCSSPDPVRLSFSLNNDWETFASDSMGFVLDDFQNEDFDSFDWIKVDVPHNWDDYGGYRRLVHGNFHGTAWYRKYFRIEKPQGDKRFFLFFEGVGSYATVWLNGDSIGYHAGGRTTFTLDVTQAIRFDKENILAVRADHPAFIKDLPWVCGGCSSDLGFSEGSQPLGIFRPVHLVVTNQVRVEPFGVHIFNNEEVSEGKATLQLSVEIKNYGNEARELIVENLLKDHKGKTVVQNSESVLVEPGWIDTLSSSLPEITNPRLWSLPDPYLYQLHTQIWEKGQLIDELISPYGIRSTRWDINSGDSVNRFFLNGKPVFINGSAEYEHLMGQSHAFSPEQIRARLAQFKAMGYNAFRDAHQPHNLLYQHLCDSLGILWWPQFSAHVWFDNPDFRTNFQQLMHDWIKERRNSPSIILWGLQNESILPDSFSLECTELVRKLDPGSPFQRLVATCNGGAGTDWNVPQNWSGTYGGNPNNYGRELIDQKMNAEYGAWRSIDHHTEGGFVQNGPLSEERIGLLMETKILQAESVRDSVCGHFHWPFISHDNPGRRQGGEGTRELDRVGPVNYKGTLTIWGEPTDLFYLYRSNYCPAEKEPMVYIVSHTWPDRWTEPGIKNNISIFSNCDEVELYNGFKENWLGKQSRGASGSRFIFDSVDVQYNVLYAVAYLKGKKVTTDIVRLNHLPEAPGLKKWAGKTKALTSSDCHYLYRVNCGGPDYTDKQGNLWMADVPYSKEGTWGSLSWADDYPGVPSFFGSQRQTYDPIKGTLDWPLIQTFRYGKHKLRYQFPVPDDTYCVELFFTEPWYGTGGGMNCKNWRLFDVAVNGETVISDLDIWSEAGHDRVLKKEYLVEVKGGMLEISFPKVKSGQAVISAIAISGFESDAKPAPSSPRLIGELKASEGIWESATWMNSGNQPFTNHEGAFVQLPPELFGAEWIRPPLKVKNNDQPLATFTMNQPAGLFVAIPASTGSKPQWLNSFEDIRKPITTTQSGLTRYQVYKKRISAGEKVFLWAADSLEETAPYPVAVVPVSILDDIIDLRPSLTYQTEDGVKLGSARQLEFTGKTCIVLPDASATYVLEFKVGLASKYGLEFRFMNCRGEEMPVHAVLLSDDNRVMWEGNWSFRVACEKWQSMKTDTQTTINAGSYLLKITPYGKGPLYLDWVKIQ